MFALAHTVAATLWPLAANSCHCGCVLSLLSAAIAFAAIKMSSELSRALAVAILQRGLPALVVQLRTLFQQLALVVRALRGTVSATAERLVPLARRTLEAAAALLRLLARSRAFAHLQAALLRCLVVGRTSEVNTVGHMAEAMPAAVRHTAAICFTLPLVKQR